MESSLAYGLSGIWGDHQNDVWAVGEKGTLLRYDGETWTEMSSGTSHSLNALWGSDYDNVFAVGDTGIALHYDGDKWNGMNSGTLRDLYAVRGVGLSDVFAVGESGTVLRTMMEWTGTIWRPAHRGTTCSAYGLATMMMSSLSVNQASYCTTTVETGKP